MPHNPIVSSSQNGHSNNTEASSSKEATKEPATAEEAAENTAAPELLWVDSGASTTTTSTPSPKSPRPRVSLLGRDDTDATTPPQPAVDPLREPLLLPAEHLLPRRESQQRGNNSNHLNNNNANNAAPCRRPWNLMVNNSNSMDEPTGGETNKNTENQHNNHNHETDNHTEQFHDEPPLNEDEEPQFAPQPQPNNEPSLRSHHHHVPWYKNPYQRMAMVSNFGTSYNVVNISLVLPILEHLLASSNDTDTSTITLDQSNTTTANAEDTSAVASSLLAGMILGQLLGGALGDSFLGLTGALRVVMVVQIAASLGSASVHTGTWGALFHFGHDNDDSSGESQHHATHSLYWQLAAWRFVLGIGAGAVYPLAACLSVEQAGRTSETHTKQALRRVVRTFAVQGLGFWAVPALTLPLLHVPHMPLEATWRTVLAVGCLPGMVLLYLQWRLGRSDPATLSLHRHTSATTLRHERVSTQSADDDDDDLGDIEGAAGAGAVVLTNGSQLNNNDDEETVGDRELMCEDSDGEVGTFLDSSPDLDLSSGPRHFHDEQGGGYYCHGESEPPAIRHGWWSSLRNEPNVWRKFMGTAVTWFLFDMLFYGNTLFQPIVVETAFGPKDASQDPDNERHVLQRTALDSFLLTSIALPGYVVAGWLVGRKTCGVTQSARYVMLQGFFFMSVLYVAIGSFWHELRQYPIVLVLLYGLTFFFANYGPNTTTFILPSLVYSAECRSTFNGLSAAMGKLGALCGATLFAPTTDAWGDAAVMLICGGIGAVAFWMTVLFVRIPSKPGEPTQDRPVTHLCFHPTAENPDSEEDLMDDDDEDDVAGLNGGLSSGSDHPSSPAANNNNHSSNRQQEQRGLSGAAAELTWP